MMEIEITDEIFKMFSWCKSYCLGNNLDFNTYIHNRVRDDSYDTGYVLVDEDFILLIDSCCGVLADVEHGKKFPNGNIVYDTHKEALINVIDIIGTELIKNY